MPYVPQFTIRPALLTEVERIAALRERIQSAAIDLAWIPALQKDTRTRNVHASTAIEGNPLTLEQVRALDEGRELSRAGGRAKREVLNYFAGLRYVENNVVREAISRLKGSIEVTSRPGQGSTFTLRLPLTLAIIQVLMARVAGESFALPLDIVVRTVMVRPTDVQRVLGQRVSAVER